MQGRTPGKEDAMEDRKKLLRNAATIAGFGLAVAAALAVKAGLPEEYAAYSGLAFFGTVLAVGGLAAFAASKFIK